MREAGHGYSISVLQDVSEQTIAGKRSWRLPAWICQKGRDSWYSTWAHECRTDGRYPIPSARWKELTHTRTHSLSSYLKRWLPKLQSTFFYSVTTPILTTPVLTAPYVPKVNTEISSSRVRVAIHCQYKIEPKKTPHSAAISQRTHAGTSFQSS